MSDWAQAIVQVQARVIATNIPGASAISQVGTFLLNTPPLAMCTTTVPFPSPIRSPVFAPFIRAGAVLDPNRILVGSRPTFTLRLPFLHLPAMPNRFIARMTVIAFNTSPPRGVGTLRFGQFLSDFAVWHFPHRLKDTL
jgi:hypothetical protein